jgi:anti-sigma factor RsiW
MRGCEKYRDWTMDAALDALGPERKREFVAHAALCESCRAKYELAGEAVAAVDQGVGSVVAGEPSPHFAARLRARMAEEQSTSRRAWPTWKPAAAALVVAAVLAIVVISSAPRHHNSALQTTRSAPETAAVERHETAEMPERPTANQVRVRRGYRTAGRHRSEPTQPEVLVPPGQFEAVLQLAAEIRSGRIDGKQLIAANQEMDKPLEIRPIVIAALEKPKSDANVPEAPADSTHP